MPSETGFQTAFFQTALESQTLFAIPYIPNLIRYKLKTTIQKTEIHIIKQTNKLIYCAILKAVSYFSHRAFPVLYMSGRHPHKRMDTDKEKYLGIKKYTD